MLLAAVPGEDALAAYPIAVVDEALQATCCSITVLAPAAGDPGVVVDRRRTGSSASALIGPIQGAQRPQGTW